MLAGVWDEPRPPCPPVRVWRDWAVVAVLVASSFVEVLLREDQAWAPLLVGVGLVVAACLLWRRTSPLAAVAVAFGTLLAFDVARIVAVDATGLQSIAGVLVLPYALLRWGAGREAAVGLGIILVWLSVTLVVEPTSPAERVAGYGFFLFSAALGAAVRYRTSSRLREIEEVRLRQRNDLARELHDIVGHRVSAIAVQAQAGRALSAADPARALATLVTIEEEASRTLTEMRALVGVLREGTGAALAPRRGVADIERLARPGGDVVGVRVQVSGDVEVVDPAVGTALYLIAAEAVTNATRHASGATRVTVDVTASRGRVRLRVHDDGAARTAGPAPAGYGLRGMAERASLLGGTLRAGPDPAGGWSVEASLPRPVRAS
ncbi:sensor histidine kinase [Pseudonocardia sp. KRD-184]|uniref:histidine kinase n=1 Tax=Pseudonocardia oceani TaxID=2792013 RepID=A0ABS6U1Y5_9PSEU|nr:sensor histidine kinase [Pseudonocardia oceani]MBW0092521.1 sensor histidine kinase [Pseudonocardia oceani]MBW0094885.1 sensor histidine kinase [Pseudonocardia oceani]MBW0111873.1 sensor histidine kinase [Pseudonocardia oceani]MBW0120584.1 sensor histidine kinase [Pseudonocardia oceani]MBW0126261.1 sensor histidine kinase [Pseudonocardia oceani]